MFLPIDFWFCTAWNDYMFCNRLFHWRLVSESISVQSIVWPFTLMLVFIDCQIKKAALNTMKARNIFVCVSFNCHIHRHFVAEKEKQRPTFWNHVETSALCQSANQILFKSSICADKDITQLYWGQQRVQKSIQGEGFYRLRLEWCDVRDVA